MRVSRSMRWAVAAAGLTVGPSVLVPAMQAQTGAGAASAPAVSPLPAVCGSTPNCAESNDFAAMITNFRTSDLRGYKILDLVVRFRNKTANPLVLGYVQGSSTAVDEKGNRYTVFGGNGVRGIGQVYGTTFDPKFMLPAGGVGDAQFELAWNPGQQIYGFTFMLDLTVDEINSYEGNQHSLGGEFPLHYEGLTNGISSGAALAGGAVPGATPCNNGGAAGTATSVAGATGSDAVQNATGRATSTIATASSTVSQLTSLFGHKKAPPPAGAQSGDPCASAATAAGAIASNNPAALATRPSPTSAKATPVIAATPASGISTAARITGTQPGPSPTATQTHAATPPTATSKTAAAIKTPPAAAPAKKPATTTTPATPD